MRSVELFSGCGCLALGVARAGFKHQLLVEWNDDAVTTLLHNKKRRVSLVKDWPVVHGDVRSIDWSRSSGNIDFVAGGPPCQPFSIGGRHSGPDDHRDMWPEAIRAVRELQPKAFLFENVRGLLRPAFAEYVQWIRLHLASPHVTRKKGENFTDHATRLERQREPIYQVHVLRVNAADYGAAQKRHRALFLGLRNDLGVELSIPKATHSRERLLWDQWVTGDYWHRHGMKAPSNGPFSAQDREAVKRLRASLLAPAGLPWRTCRDAFGDLDEPRSVAKVSNHMFQDGARSYKGHTGSPLDEAAKALKAGDHGVPGGENMLVRSNGSVRYFTVRESARLQGLPDSFEFPGSWTETMRQLGNAVPVPLAEAMAGNLADLLTSAAKRPRRATKAA